VHSPIRFNESTPHPGEEIMTAPAQSEKPLVVCWSEGTAPKEVYPEDINNAVAAGLREALPAWEVVSASLNDLDQGLSQERLDRCRVLIWWGHQRHREVSDELTEKIVARVEEDGMGFISLHSSHFAKPNIALMSQEPTEPEILGKVRPEGRVAAWGNYLGDSVKLTIRVKDLEHPVSQGLPEEFTFDHHERYQDPYAVPRPDAVILEGDATLQDGTVDCSQQGFCWTIGKGRMLYFQARHETDPVFFDPNVRRLIANAVQWAASSAD